MIEKVVGKVMRIHCSILLFWQEVGWGCRCRDFHSNTV